MGGAARHRGLAFPVSRQSYWLVSNSSQPVLPGVGEAHGTGPVVTTQQQERPAASELHPGLRALLDKAAVLPPTHLVPIEETRRNGPARYQIGVPPDPVASVEDRTVDGPGGKLALRIYRPDDMPDRPVTVFFHGGGFVICSLDTHDGMCRQICHRSGTVVVSVDYRMAPEHTFPAAPDDCLAALRWAAANAASFGGDPARIAVAGDSAGGNLAAVTALRARDGGPAIRAQLLIYPVTDHYSAGHVSYAGLGAGYGLLQETRTWCWDLYLPDPAHAAHPDASPLRSASLAGLPPAYVVTAGFDLLRDEGRAYARQLRRAGVAVDEAHYADMNHGFFAWVGLIDRSTEAMDAACAWLRRALDREG